MSSHLHRRIEIERIEQLQRKLSGKAGIFRLELGLRCNCSRCAVHVLQDCLRQALELGMTRILLSRRTFHVFPQIAGKL